jgi:hypothetical protein
LPSAPSAESVSSATESRRAPDAHTSTICAISPDATLLYSAATTGAYMPAEGNSALKEEP